MVLIFKLIGWAAMAGGAALLVSAAMNIQEVTLSLFHFASGSAACYWGYLLARRVPEESDEWSELENPDDDWGW